MQIRQLDIRDFRNLAAVKLAPSPRFNVFFGDNAQGKTSLLEAIYFALLHRSFRGARALELIRFGKESAQVEQDIERAELQHHLKVVLQAHVRRRIEVDGKGVASVSAWPRGLTAIVFAPEDLRILRAAPAERRRLIDDAVVNIWPAYQVICRDYGRALQNRNRLLRDPSRGTDLLLETYEAQLAQFGAKVVAARGRYLLALAPTVGKVFSQITGKGDLTLAYGTEETTRARLDDPRALAAALANQLAQSRKADRVRGQTTIGPHTEDIEVSLDGRPAKQYASQGQLRAILLAVKIAQILDIYERFQDYPALLLDDVSSELDPERNRYLFEFISQIPLQVFLTTTRAELIPVVDNSKYFHVVMGEIREVFRA